MATVVSREGKLYSVDLLVAYVNVFKPGVIQMPLSSLTESINRPCWVDISSGNKFTIGDVLAHPERYPGHAEQVKNADLSYPTIWSRNYGMLDGKHRLAKAVRDNHESIKACLVSNEVVEKCRIPGAPEDWDTIQLHLKPHQLITLFDKRFRQ